MAVVFLIEPSREDIASAQRGCLNTLDIIEKMMLYTKAGFMMLDIEKIEMEEPWIFRGRQERGAPCIFCFPRRCRLWRRLGRWSNPVGILQQR